MGNNHTMQTVPDIVELPVEGDLDVALVSKTRSQIDDLIDHGCRRIILNMANVSYVDSAGMGMIFSETRKIRTLGGLISLMNVSDAVHRALAIACLIDFVPVSKAGPRPPVPALDPTVAPLWRRTMSVDPAHMGTVRERVAQLLAGMPLTPDEVFDMTLAGGEALGNAVDHTCAEGVLISVLGYPDRVIMEVTDCGDGFDLDAGEGSSETGERGRGIKLMRLLADSVEFSTKPSGKGTLVRLVKLTRSASASRPKAV